MTPAEQALKDLTTILRDECGDDEEAESDAEFYRHAFTEQGAAAERARLRPLIKAARDAVVHNVDPDHAMWTPIADAFDALEAAAALAPKETPTP